MAQQTPAYYLWTIHSTPQKNKASKKKIEKKIGG
jgi:hypothetical protein